jgi:signal transduction histidine kinase
MRYHCLVPLTAAVATMVISALVIRGGFRDRLHRTFFFTALASVAWNLDIFSLYYFHDEAAAEFWSRVFRVGVCMAPVLSFHFGLALSGSGGQPWRTLLVAGYTLCIAFSVANLGGFLVRDISPHEWGWYVEPGPLYTLFTVTLIAFLLLWIERVWYSYRHPSSPRQRVQAKFWLLAGLIQIPFALTNLLPVYGFNVYPLGNIGSVMFTGIVAYAIVRHRLMDVDYVVRKGVSFSVAATVVLIPGGIGMSALARAVGAYEPLVVVCASVGLALLSVVLIPTLQEALETRVHRAFFPERYDYRLRLRQLAAALVHVLDQSKLVRGLGDALGDILDVESCQVFVRDEQTKRLTLVYPVHDAEQALADELAQALDRLPGPVLASEIDTVSPLAVPLFRERAWEVGIPLRINDRLTGFIGLARNREFRIFSSEDLQLLATVAGGASVALENAALSRQLRRSEIVLERANQLSSLGMLAAGIAHEIRNPLVAVKTFLDLLPQRLDDKEFLSHFRDLSLGELRRVTDLISDLLALGKSKLPERRSIEIAPTLEPVVRLMESSARKRQIDVQVRLEADLPAIWADPDQLKQISLNLLLNAIEMSPPGGQVSLDVRPVVADAVVLEVRDQGPGIPTDQLENIFHPFFTTKESGTGLGLALVHQMVVEHGGEITVESTVGRGTLFSVRLPTARAALTHAAPPDVTYRAAASS